MKTGESDLDPTVRRADPDRWLSSRFIADPVKRADVVAIYAFNQELARTALGAREPMVAEIRLTWWREGLDDLLAGKAPRGGLPASSSSRPSRHQVRRISATIGSRAAEATRASSWLKA